MYRSRRGFLVAAMTGLAATALGRQQQQQASPPLVRPPNARSPFPNDPPLLPEVPKPDSRTLKANREAIKKDVAHMTELVQQLHDGLDANDTTDVLSLDVLKKCDEIEKLAKQVRNLVRG
jgi:hypothetical protein